MSLYEQVELLYESSADDYRYQLHEEHAELASKAALIDELLQEHYPQLEAVLHPDVLRGLARAIELAQAIEKRTLHKP